MQTLFLLKDHPSSFHLPLWGRTVLEPAVGLYESRAWSSLHCVAGVGFVSSPAAGATHPVAPLLLSVCLCLASRAGAAPHGAAGSLACTSVGSCATSPQLLCFVLLAAVLGQSGVQAEATPLLSKGGLKTRGQHSVGRRKERPVEAISQENRPDRLPSFSRIKGLVG